MEIIRIKQLGGIDMVVDTVWGLTVKKNEIMTLLENNPELPQDMVDSYWAKINMFDIEIELIKDIC